MREIGRVREHDEVCRMKRKSVGSGREHVRKRDERVTERRGGEKKGSGCREEEEGIQKKGKYEKEKQKF